MNNSLELLPYDARTECMRGWLISSAYVGIKRSSEQSGAGASTFRRRCGVCSPTLSHLPNHKLAPWTNFNCQIFICMMYILHSISFHLFDRILYAKYLFLPISKNRLINFQIDKIISTWLVNRCRSTSWFLVKFMSIEQIIYHRYTVDSIKSENWAPERWKRILQLLPERTLAPSRWAFLRHGDDLQSLASHLHISQQISVTKCSTGFLQIFKFRISILNIGLSDETFICTPFVTIINGKRSLLTQFLIK